MVGMGRKAVVCGVTILGLCRIVKFSGLGFRFERRKRHVMRAARTPRKAIPPTTPPIIAGVLLPMPPLPPLLMTTAEGDGDVAEPGREDSTPPILWARVTLNVSCICEDILVTVLTKTYRNTIPKHSDKHRLVP